MNKRKQISITEFKAKCLEIVRQVEEDGVPYSITKHRKPVAEIHPTPKSEGSNPLEGSILYEGDILSPIYHEWNIPDLPSED
jgi:prevent-host-death family protein